MITGARQVGKTFIVREFARTHYESFIEFNFIKNPAARDIFKRQLTKRMCCYGIGGEVDFLIEREGRVFPIEAKSGSDCGAHAALDKLIAAREYGIAESLVLNKSGDVRQVGAISYLPVYFLMFMCADVMPDRMVYRVDE